MGIAPMSGGEMQKIEGVFLIAIYGVMVFTASEMLAFIIAGVGIGAAEDRVKKIEFQ